MDGRTETDPRRCSAPPPPPSQEVTDRRLAVSIRLHNIVVNNFPSAQFGSAAAGASAFAVGGWVLLRMALI